MTQDNISFPKILRERKEDKYVCLVLQIRNSLKRKEFIDHNSGLLQVLLIEELQDEQSVHKIQTLSSLKEDTDDSDAE